MKNYFLFLFFLVISVSGYAQGKRITGKVTDAADGMPIIGATVVAVDPDGKTNAKSVGTITVFITIEQPKLIRNIRV